MREQTGEFGRSPQDVRGAIYLWGGVDQAGESRRWVIDFVSNVYQQDFTPLADRYLLHGTPDQVVDRIGQYAEAGAETLILSPVGPAERRTRIVETFASEVLPQLR